MSEKSAMDMWQENRLGVCAKGVAAAFAMDSDDVRDAYRDKPDSLATHFDTVSQAKKKQPWYIGWGIFWTFVVFPAALYPAYKLCQISDTLDNVEKTIRSKVENTKKSQGRRSEDKPSQDEPSQDEPSQDGPQP